MSELFAPGHRTCAGCGAAIVVRLMLNTTGKDVIIANATGCIEVSTTPYPESSWRVPWIHSLFENAPAVASGIEAALKRQGRKTKVVCFGGDGSTYDIGFGALSGMLERGHDVLYICYDNEAYMNTGVQRSGATPHYASTTTSPSGKKSKGKIQKKKPIVEICAAHGIPYAASASIAYPVDFQNKIKKALEIEGPKFIVVHSPCPPGWGYNEGNTVGMSKLAVQTGLWSIYEIEDGKKKFNVIPKDRKPVSDYLSAQKRFKHLTEDDMREIQREVDNFWAGTTQ